MQRINVVWRNLGFDSQHIGIRYDQHNSLARADNTSYCVKGELMDNTVLRRDQIEVLELILGCDLALAFASAVEAIS